MKKLFSVFFITTILSIFIATSYSAEAAEIGAHITGEDITEAGEPAESLPSYYSSKDLGYTTSVKTQIGNVCWAYASTSSFETLALKDGFYIGDYNSELLDLFGTKRPDGNGWQRGEFAAGYTYIPIGYFMSWNGPVVNDGDKPTHVVTGLSYIFKENRQQIKKLIMKSGAVTANFNTYSRAYSKDQCSYCLTDEISQISGHTVSVIGWDDNYDKAKFDGNYTPNENGAWLCKNSWGPEKNDIGGYLWISYEDFYLFNDETFGPSFGIDSIKEIKDSDHLYQNEVDGATYELEFNDADSTTFFNVFDFSENGNVLDKVVFESISEGSDYTVYLANLDGNGAPVSNKDEWKELKRGTVDYKGYICCELDDITVPEEKCAIGIEINNEKLNQGKTEKTLTGLGVNEWLRSSITKEMIYIMPCESGKSFITYHGSVVDLKDYYKEVKSDEIGGTLVIKAITDGVKNTRIAGDINIDGTVDINDVTCLQKYLAGYTTVLSTIQSENADFNSDGKININDATAIQRHLANM